MKITSLSLCNAQLSLLAMRQAYQPKPSKESLRDDLEALAQALQVLYPELKTPAAPLVLQRALYAGALRAKEFMQLQQAQRALEQAPSLDELSSHTQHARDIFATFVPHELLLRWAKYPQEALALLVSQDEIAQLEALAALGVRDPEGLLAQLAQLPRDECSARWLRALPESPDPARSLRWLLALVEAPFGRGHYRLFSQREGWMRALLRLTGLSEALSRLLLRSPELAEDIFLQASFGGPKTQNRSIEALRAWQPQEELRILLAWCAERLTLYEAQRALSQLAEACVARCFDVALAEDAAQHARRAPRLAIIALGSLGAAEMLYQSDLDLLFLSDGAADTEERCTRIAQRTIALLSAKQDEGSLYEIDTRLRPSGTQGPLVVSTEAWARYFGLTQSEGPRGHLWEEQALLRARPLTGDAEVLAIFLALHQRVLRRPRVTHVVFAELRQMRQKIEQEVPKHQRFYYKASSGGLQDIDFLAQALQLTHGDKAPDLLCPTTHHTLTLLSGAGLLSSEDATLLLSAHARWLTLILMTRLLVEKNLDFVPARSDALRRALCASEVSSEESFQKQLEALRAQVRACFDRVVH